MKRNAKYLICILLVVHCYAQSKIFDSVQVYWKAQDFAKAAEILEAEYSKIQKSGSLEDRREVLRWLPVAYAAVGNFRKAIALREEDLALLRANRAYFSETFSNDEGSDLESLGLLNSKLGNHAVAVQYLKQAVADEESLPGFRGLGPSNVLRSLGIAQYLAGDFVNAEKTLRKALESARQFNALGNTSGSIAEHDVEILRWLERALIAQKRTDEALQIAQTSRAGSLGAELAARLGSGSRNSLLPLSLDQIKELARAERSTLVEYSIAYELNPVLQLQFSNYKSIPASALNIWVISPGGQITFRQVTFEKQPLPLAALVGQTRDAIGVRGLFPVEATSQGTAPQPPPQIASGPQSKQLLQQLYKVLITPIEDLLPADPRQRVILFPQDLLYMVPFAALEDQTGTYLIQKHTLASEISMETLLLERRKFDELPASGGAALIVGNPTMPAGLPQLPGAEVEAKAIAGLFGAEAFIGPRATKSAVLERAPNSRIIHFATHGLLSGESELMSSVVLAPEGKDSGFLTAQEMGGFQLNAEMAVLSACNTGQGKLTGDGVVGLARSFVEAGIPSLVVSLWSIPDAPTSTFMVQFYNSLHAGHDKAESLRDAMLSTMKRFPEPGAWAAFTLIGVPEASVSLKTVHGSPAVMAPPEPVVFPFAPGARKPDQTGWGKENLGIRFETSQSIDEILDFYSKAFAKQGLTDDGQRFVGQNGTFVMKTFHDPRRKRDVEVIADQGRPGDLHVSVRYAEQR